ncbi:uncharacterized protein LOC106179278 [Lingula anatina]|uniref:Uncharacterized protein LOC106179278 n=1 Tax=Lingula anatina TaxID=7574 RepID=A0A1S3K6L7_LINAN|nr:uncharacterized protein LOC106179278 [Lingula anatina]|eukprot:XP_013418280.1 uncharacterized protein LOC106179278 [Lingula anatina]
MGFRMISTVISVLLFIQYSEATDDKFLSDDAVEKNSSHLFTMEEDLEDDVETPVKNDAWEDIGKVTSVVTAGLDVINNILDSLPNSITRTCIVTIRNFMERKSLVNPVVYTKASRLKVILPRRIGPGQATVLEFDQAEKDGKPEGSFVYNIEGTVFFVTILFHVGPPTTYNARIFAYRAKYSAIKETLHDGMKSISPLYPLVADDTIRYVIRPECGYKVSVVMTDLERATMQVDVYDCHDSIDKAVLVVAKQPTTTEFLDTLNCNRDVRTCQCCKIISYTKSGSRAFFSFPATALYMFFTTLLAMLYCIPQNVDF